MKPSLTLISEVAAPLGRSQETSSLDDEGLCTDCLSSLPDTETPPHLAPLSSHFNGVFSCWSLGRLPPLYFHFILVYLFHCLCPCVLHGEGWMVVTCGSGDQQHSTECPPLISHRDVSVISQDNATVHRFQPKISFSLPFSPLVRPNREIISDDLMNVLIKLS